jgi:hypothetical protein
MRLTQASLETLAENTGGFAAVNTNSFVDAFDRIVEANSHYYLLGYAAPNHPRNGQFHRIEVKVNRPGVTVVARRGYPAPSRDLSREERSQSSLQKWALERRQGGTNDTSIELRAALNRAVQQTGLDLAVQAVALKGASGATSTVVLTVEVSGNELAFTEQANALLADTLELSYFALDLDGEPHVATRSAVNLAILANTHQRVKTHGIRLNTRTVMPRGRYQLRIGARDVNGGKVGTVFSDLIVPDFSSEPLMISGLLLSSSSAADVLTAQRDEPTERLLGAPPSVRRTFTRRETLRVLAEIYDNMPANETRRIRVDARMIDERGQDVFSSESHLRNGPGGEPAWSAIGYVTQIPLSTIRPGRYLLRVEVTNPRNGTPVSAETLVSVTED